MQRRTTTYRPHDVQRASRGQVVQGTARPRAAQRGAHNAYSTAADRAAARAAASRPTVKRRTTGKPRFAARALAVACLSVVVAGCIGFGVASANNGLAAAGSFGVDEETAAATATTKSAFDEASDKAYTGQASLSKPTSHDISAGVKAIEEQRAADEAARKQAETEATKAQAEALLASQGAVSNGDGTYTMSDGTTVDLSEIDWSVGEDAFVSEWTNRINTYLAGSNLEGYGAVFAQAAWNNGVDPRWSPAIAYTESSLGGATFASYNAWGWGSSGFSSWEEAINTQVAGLANGYGSTISQDAANKYCPPNSAQWYQRTAEQMQQM